MTTSSKEKRLDTVEIALTPDVFAHRAAVQAVQEQHFDGHPILYRDVEAGLDETVETVEDLIAAAMRGEREDHLATDCETIHATVKEGRAGQVAARWIRNARVEAMEASLEGTAEHDTFIWNTLREQAGVKP